MGLDTHLLYKTPFKFFQTRMGLGDADNDVGSLYRLKVWEW